MKLSPPLDIRVCSGTAGRGLLTIGTMHVSATSAALSDTDLPKNQTDISASTDKKCAAEPLRL